MALKLIRMGLISTACLLLILLADDISKRRHALAMSIYEKCPVGSYRAIKISTDIFSDGLTVQCESYVIHKKHPNLLHQQTPRKKEEPSA